MSTPNPLHNKQQRKKARRKDRKQRERAAHRNLDEVTEAAVEEALVAAAELTGPAPGSYAVTLDVELASPSEGLFVRKRINDALNVGEWLNDVRVVLRGGDNDTDLELRIERVSSAS